jgi:trigger factor
VEERLQVDEAADNNIKSNAKDSINTDANIDTNANNTNVTFNANSSNNYIIEDETSIKKKANIKIDIEKAKGLLETKLKTAAKKSNIKGFRPGKTPLSVIKKYYEEELFEEAKLDVLNEDFKKLISDLKFFVVGKPSVGKVISEDTYEISFEVMPSIDKVNEDIKIKEIKKREITEEVIQDEINFLLEKVAETEKVDSNEPINDKDRYLVKIDYVTLTSEDKIIDNAKDYELHLNSSTIERSFEASLIGKKVTDSFEFDDKERGVIVKGAIKEIEKRILPELNDAILKNFGDFSDVDEFKNKIKLELGKYEEKKQRQALISVITDELIKINKIEIPESMIEEYADERFEALKKEDRGRYESADEKQKKDIFNMLKLMAKRDISSYFLIGRIAKLENITVDESDLEKFYKETYEESGLDIEEIKKLYSNHDGFENLKNQLLEEKIFDFLINNKVSYIMA